MPGTKLGGQKAAATNKALYGDDFFKKIGAKGGRNSHRGGFAANPALARIAGRKGGLLSHRGPTCYYEVWEDGEIVFTGNGKETCSHLHISYSTLYRKVEEGTITRVPITK